jgi:hypothetical protein
VTEYLEKFFRALIAVTVYDFFWLFFHSKGYWNSEYSVGLRRFSLFFSYLNFFAKIVLAASLHVQILKAKQAAKNQNQANNNPINLTSTLPIKS